MSASKQTGKVMLIASDFGQPDAIDVDKLLSEGWIYCDPPTRFSFEMWDLWCSVIGQENYRLLAMTEGPDYKRGQFLISPTGTARLRDYASTQSASADVKPRRAPSASGGT